MTEEKLELRYEEAVKELEGIVAALEADDLPLDRSLELYKKGRILIAYCAEMLNKAQLQVTQLPTEE